jgi:hypothetical protein
MKPMSVLLKPKPLHWTLHAKHKMRHYGLSEQRVRRILHTPKRIEEGVAPETIACMQSSGSPKHPHELWVMIVEEKSRRKIISAWRYPGVTKPRSELSRNILAQEFSEYAAKA